MPLYDFKCGQCGREEERFLWLRTHDNPGCCGQPMDRMFSGGLLIKERYPTWVDRMEDIHKAQEQRGERFRHIDLREVDPIRSHGHVK